MSVRSSTSNSFFLICCWNLMEILVTNLSNSLFFTRSDIRVQWKCVSGYGGQELLCDRQWSSAWCAASDHRYRFSKDLQNTWQALHWTFWACYRCSNPVSCHFRSIGKKIVFLKDNIWIWRISRRLTYENLIFCLEGTSVLFSATSYMS